MKPLDHDELFQHLRGFLKDKGIELQEGSYSSGIRKSCSLLSDAINLGQEGLDRAKTGIDKKLDQMRQVIHEKTAPRKSPPASSSAEPAAAPPSSATTAPRTARTAKPKRSRRTKRKTSK